MRQMACIGNTKQLYMVSYWNNISNIIFCGGGANYHSLSQTFEDYQKAYGIKNDIAIKTFSKDAEWVGVFSTMRLSLEREMSTISIDYNN